MISNLKQPLVVVAYDAGGANQLIAMLQANDCVSGVRAYMEGPAKKVWQKLFPSHSLCESLSDAIAGGRSLLSGTGWASDLEFAAIDKATRLGLYTVALLDHWTNYERRFIRQGRTVRPDEYWVVDHYASRIATKAFPREHVRQVRDYYLKAQVEKITTPTDDERTLLYILEPARSSWGRDRPGEFQALDYLLENLPLMPLPKGIRILLRPHPSEVHGKYTEWLTEHADINVALDNSPTLSDAISQAHWVAGCESYALVVALAAGRSVYCTLPPWAPDCRLPHEGMIQVKSLKL